MPPSLPKAKTYDGTDVKHHTIPTFQFLNGKTLSNISVAYRSINPSSRKGVILIPTCFSGWINTTLSFSSDQFNALKDYHVVVAAMLSNGESTSPSNTSDYLPVGQQHYEDVIRAHYDMLTTGLGVKQLEAVIGFSMGGQQAYHWAVMYPDFVRSIVSICSSARTSPHNYAFLEGPICAMQNSEDYIAWKRGAKERPTKGLMAFGRTYSAWLTSAEWFRRRLYRERLGFKSVEAWIEGGREESTLTQEADDLLMNARMWQMGDIGATAHKEVGTLGGGVGKDDLYEAALKGIKCPVLLMPCRTDQYFPPEDSEIEMKFLQRGKLSVIESCWGHIAGGGANEEDTKFMNDEIRKFIES